MLMLPQICNCPSLSIVTYLEPDDDDDSNIYNKTPLTMLIKQCRSQMSHVIICSAFFWLVTLAFHTRSRISIQRINSRRSWGTDVCGFPQPISYSEPHGCFLQSPVAEGYPTEAVKAGVCNYFTENFVRAYCWVEEETHEVVRRLITPWDVVLEVGSRYGTTSCEVAAAQNNSGALISVEPDHVVWAAAEFNKMSHNCRGYSVLGALGEKDVWVEGYRDEEEMGEQERKSYHKKAMRDGSGGGGGDMVRIRHFTWDYVEQSTQLRINTVILDCEGCWLQFIEEHEDRIRNQIEKIVLENDHDNITESIMGLEKIKSWGFKQDKKISNGDVRWLASVMVFTK